MNNNRRKMNSQKFILETYCMLLKNIPEEEKEHIKDFEKIGDTISHKAPEIMHLAWKDIFNYCSENFNDQTCDWHIKMRDLYNSRYNEWNRLDSK